MLIEDGRAVGVEYRQDGAVHQVRARKEVVLSGGAYNSPQLLMLSGIGPRRPARQNTASRAWSTRRVSAAIFPNIRWST